MPLKMSFPSSFAQPGAENGGFGGAESEDKATHRLSICYIQLARSTSAADARLYRPISTGRIHRRDDKAEGDFPRQILELRAILSSAGQWDLLYIHIMEL